MLPQIYAGLAFSMTVTHLPLLLNKCLNKLDVRTGEGHPAPEGMPG